MKVRSLIISLCVMPSGTTLADTTDTPHPVDQGEGEFNFHIGNARAKQVAKEKCTFLGFGYGATEPSNTSFGR